MDAKPIIFRDTEGESEIIDETRRKLGLNTDSAAIRVLLRQGKANIDGFIEHAWNVIQGLKYTEIDFFTSSLNIILKKRRRELKEQKRAQM